MKILAISDLHLSFSGAKPMGIFGPWWNGHAERVESAWRRAVGPEDVVCLPGDFSWAMRPLEAKAELDWLGALPGVKLLVKGNHDYWWGSLSKVRQLLPPSIRLIQGDSVTVGEVAFGGARGWVNPALDFGGLSGHPTSEELRETGAMGKNPDEDRAIYVRELGRLEASLSRLDPGASRRVALLHYPPTSPLLETTEVTELLEKYRVDAAVFGHLHRSAPSDYANPFGVRNGIAYYLVSADFVDFAPLEIIFDG